MQVPPRTALVVEAGPNFGDCGVLDLIGGDRIAHQVGEPAALAPAPAALAPRAAPQGASFWAEAVDRAAVGVRDEEGGHEEARVEAVPRLAQEHAAGAVGAEVWQAAAHGHAQGEAALIRLEADDAVVSTAPSLLVRKHRARGAAAVIPPPGARAGTA